VTPPPRPPEPQNRVYRESSAKAIALVLFVLLAMIMGVALGLSAQSIRRNLSNDVIVACLQKERMPAYGVGPAGPPVHGKPVTAEMFTVICVEEK
jgi:hypothetical protein